jgi:ATP-binding protein involved in chromosome partitioning
MQENTDSKKENEPKLEPGMHPSFINVLMQRKAIKEKTKNIKHKIGVYSAKGGVGKTTIAVNIAYALSNLGYKVGLVDVDIDCPNITFFLGINEVVAQEYPLIPILSHGMKVVSTAMFLENKEMPIIWRGPMKAKMLREFLENTEWGELDYLILDLPPGTSDLPLSLMQLLDMDGILLVTTPQDVAAKNAIRSGLMAKSLNIAVLGIVENMSDEKPSGALSVAKALESEVIGIIKQSKKFNTMSDSGHIPAEEDKEIREAFISIAKKLISS